MENEEYQQIIEQWKLDNKQEVLDGKVKKVFLENLPRWKDGKNKASISWFDTFGKIVRFIYYNTEGNVKIINYNSTKQQLIVMYNDKEINIKTSSFMNCNFGRKFGVIKYTNDFNYDIGQIFKDDKRDFTITDREYRKDKNGQNRKWYKYTCAVS